MEKKSVEIPANAHIQSLAHEADGHFVKDPEASLNQVQETIPSEEAEEITPDEDAD